MSERYAVVGNPVAHSKSPFIHARFAEQTGEDIVYEALLAPLDGFIATVRDFAARGGRGVNVTVPFKLEAHRLADACSTRAARAGAVNTLRFESDGTFFGDNTDGIGLLRDLRSNLGRDLEGARVLVLGAGGAARGVLGPLLDAHPASLVVANRTASRARDLARAFAAEGVVRGSGYGSLAGARFDLVVNATAAGLGGETTPLPAGLLDEGACCYDLAYGPAARPFLAWASTQGAALAVDGTGMLVEQAAESFHVWRGVRPDTQPVIDALRSSAADPAQGH